MSWCIQNLSNRNRLVNNQRVNIPQLRTVIISAVKVCEECLLTASAEGDEDRGIAPGLHWETSVPYHWGTFILQAS